MQTLKKLLANGEQHDMRLYTLGSKKHPRFAIDCSCGWGTPVCGNVSRAKQLYDEHVEHARNNDPRYSIPY